MEGGQDSGTEGGKKLRQLTPRAVTPGEKPPCRRRQVSPVPAGSCWGKKGHDEL